MLHLDNCPEFVIAWFACARIGAVAVSTNTRSVARDMASRRQHERAAVGADPELARAVREEIADVLFYLVRLTDVLGVDLDAAAREKLQLNAARYPVERSRGSNRKHSAPPG